MSRQEIFEKVKEVFADFFDGNVEITEETTMENCEEWESVSHIQLVFEIEEAFDTEFEAEEIAEMVTIQKIIDVVESKI